MRGQALLAVTALASALMAVQPASAQRYNSYQDAHVARSQQCATARSNGAVGGAILGGLLGAVLGSQAGARGHRTDGSLVGGALGAAAGAAIGHSNADQRCNQQVEGRYDPYYGQPQDQRYAERSPYDDGSGLAGGPYERRSYGDRGGRRAYNDRNDCRMGEVVTRDPDGYELRDSVYMCRGRDGVWRPQEG